MCANKKFLTDILRHEWGFRGYVVSDAGAVSGIKDGHHFVNTSEQTAAAAIKAGCNLDLTQSSRPIFNFSIAAIKQNLLTEVSRFDGWIDIPHSLGGDH